MAEEKTRKCYNCRKEMKDEGKILCKQCEGKPVKTSSGTLIIYDKI